MALVGRKRRGRERKAIILREPFFKRRTAAKKGGRLRKQGKKKINAWQVEGEKVKEINAAPCSLW